MWKICNWRISGKLEEWKFKKCKIGNMEYLENVKKDNRNTRERVIEGYKCKNLKGYTME